jgi:DNA-directed RNA polymerase subunit RPC12/RpoP
MEKILKNGLLFKLLDQVDLELAQAAQIGRCQYCGSKLHRGDYPRKPRGGPDWTTRYSFDCSQCRRRNTPPSVRFLGRRVYIGVVVVLVTAMTHGVNPRRVEVLRRELKIDERTLKRWREWWLTTFVEGPFWKAARARFMPQLQASLLPLSLVDTFDAGGCAGMVKLLQFLMPITVISWKAGQVM